MDTLTAEYLATCEDFETLVTSIMDDRYDAFCAITARVSDDEMNVAVAIHAIRALLA